MTVSRSAFIRVASRQANPTARMLADRELGDLVALGPVNHDGEVRDYGRRKVMRISRLLAQSSSRVGRMVPGSWG